jgi:hypothetical protein
MTRSVDLHGLTLAQAEAEVAALIDEAQQTALEDFEIAMADLGSTARDDIDAELERRRAELRLLRDAALARLRDFVKRGGQKLQ